MNADTRTGFSGCEVVLHLRVADLIGPRKLAVGRTQRQAYWHNEVAAWKSAHHYDNCIQGEQPNRVHRIAELFFRKKQNLRQQLAKAALLKNNRSLKSDPLALAKRLS
eukprot:6196141-Pleurochrysis_carterae.AAC.6